MKKKKIKNYKLNNVIDLEKQAELKLEHLDKVITKDLELLNTIFGQFQNHMLTHQPKIISQIKKHLKD